MTLPPDHEPVDENHSHDPTAAPTRRRRGEPQDVRRSERAMLAHVVLADDPIPALDALDELRALTEAAGAPVVGEMHQRRRVPDGATCLGAGRVEELKRLAEERSATLVVFGSDLSPAQGVNLEKRLGVRVVDRSQLIMDLFAARARTHQARLQVELAQLEYSLPRLKRLWTHLDRYKGGIGMRGPGETQLELDRREIEKKISDRRRKIREIEAHHELRRLRRGERYSVGLIGYTNAGKSTLFNRLTESAVVAENRPFTTLDTKTSAWSVDDGCTVLLSDTIGFIRDLPHHLIASFHATLQETLHADLLLHIVDGTRPDALHLIDAVEAVLAQVGAKERPRMLVVNKVDHVADRALLGRFGVDAALVSARTGAGLPELARRIGMGARAGHVEAWLRVPMSEGRWLARLRSEAEVLETSYEDSCCILRVRASKAVTGRLRRFSIDPPASGDARLGA